MENDEYLSIATKHLKPHLINILTLCGFHSVSLIGGLVTADGELRDKDIDDIEKTVRDLTPLVPETQRLGILGETFEKHPELFRLLPGEKIALKQAALEIAAAKFARHLPVKRMAGGGKVFPRVSYMNTQQPTSQASQPSTPCPYPIDFEYLKSATVASLKKQFKKNEHILGPLAEDADFDVVVTVGANNKAVGVCRCLECRRKIRFCFINNKYPVCSNVVKHWLTHYKIDTPADTSQMPEEYKKLLVEQGFLMTNGTDLEMEPMALESAISMQLQALSPKIDQHQVINGTPNNNNLVASKEMPINLKIEPHMNGSNGHSLELNREMTMNAEVPTTTVGETVFP